MKTIPPAIAEHVMEENEKLRGLLEAALYYIPSNKTELRALIDAALSQQAEPTDTFTAVDMATAAAQGFRDGQAAVEPAPAQDERGDELEAIHQYAFEVGGTEGGRYMLEPEELDEVARRACEPFEDVLRSLACSLGAGGYNALTVDPAVFEQKIRWGIDQLTRPAQTEQQPVSWQFYQNGKWWNGDDRIKDHRKNTEAAGIPVRDLYAAPIAQTEQKPIRMPERKRTEHLPKEYKTMTVVRAGLEAYNRALDDVAALNAAPIAQTAPLDADTLAEIIRKVDGNHSLGAGVLAERIVAELSSAPSPAKRGDA